MPSDCAQTPMSDHVARFWRLLESDAEVRIIVQTYDASLSSSAFPDDVAKAIAADRRALTAAAPHMTGAVQVKPLEWEERIGVTGTFDAETSIGRYIASSNDDGDAFWFLLGSTRTVYVGVGINVAKAAAQADYEQRVRSALVATPPASSSADSGMLAALKCIANAISAGITETDGVHRLKMRDGTWLEGPDADLIRDTFVAIRDIANSALDKGGRDG